MNITVNSKLTKLDSLFCLTIISCVCLYGLNRYSVYVAMLLVLVLQPAYRELISVLLSDMYGTLVNSKEMMKGTVCCSDATLYECLYHMSLYTGVMA